MKLFQTLTPYLLCLQFMASGWAAEESSQAQDQLQDRDSDRHWAFQPTLRPEVPVIQEGLDYTIQGPIDSFIARQLMESGLEASPKADRRVLIRRATFALTGLPPTPEELERWMNDADPHWYSQFVDQSLASSSFGEHWARRWLDVARYSDTKGYVYGREEKNWPHAWVYRDWVVQAFNEDMPYDRFLLLQLAADQVEDRRPEDLAAMGFLTVGRRFLGVSHDIIDDRIDVVTRGMLGLTVSCARCHDHKYDAIPTADYYSLYSVFDNSIETLKPVGGGSEMFWDGHRERMQKLDSKLEELKEEAADRVRSRIGDYLNAQTELEKYPAAGFDQIFQETDILPAFVHAWRDYLRAAKEKEDPVFQRWHAYKKIPQSNFAKLAIEVDDRLKNSAHLNSWIEAAFVTPPLSFDEVILRYSAVFEAVLEIGQASELADLVSLRRVMFGPGSPCEVPEGGVVHTEAFYATDSINAIWELQKQIDRGVLNASEPVQVALALQDRQQTHDTRILLRGDPLNQGAIVPRRFLKALDDGEKRRQLKHGSGRLELAKAIVDPGNPLVARVIVNRIWLNIFGAGLVTSPSDFGVRADLPSHPDLLDWLAAELIDEGWSLKSLIRQMVLSEAFQQTSTGPKDLAILKKALSRDPENRLLWRANPRRLTFEEIRDSLFHSTSDLLESEVGGRPVDIFSPPYSKRRALYGKVDRQFVASELRVFDFANPDLHIAQRSETTVPQQALFFINHPLVLDRARALAEASADGTSSVESRVRDLFQRTLQRDPTPTELEESLELIESQSMEALPPPPLTAKDWAYGVGELDEDSATIQEFTPLPYFTGQAWQGGPNWPDAKFGWAQLTANGGHPGNTRKHAVVRRWTAPRSMTLQITSQLSQDSQPGDGIRAFVVHETEGVLGSAEIHVDKTSIDVSEASIQAGDRIDFVVDIRDVLNSDEFTWKIKILEKKQSPSEEDPIQWDSVQDFPQDRVVPLSPWEQLAQALFCSNEFLFVD